MSVLCSSFLTTHQISHLPYWFELDHLAPRSEQPGGIRLTECWSPMQNLSLWLHSQGRSFGFEEWAGPETTDFYSGGENIQQAPESCFGCLQACELGGFKTVSYYCLPSFQYKNNTYYMQESKCLRCDKAKLWWYYIDLQNWDASQFYSFILNV